MSEPFDDASDILDLLEQVPMDPRQLENMYPVETVDFERIIAFVTRMEANGH